MCWDSTASPAFSTSSSMNGPGIVHPPPPFPHLVRLSTLIVIYIVYLKIEEIFLERNFFFSFINVHNLKYIFFNCLRFEMERSQWEVEKAELQARIAFLQVKKNTRNCAYSCIFSENMVVVGTFIPECSFAE